MAKRISNDPYIVDKVSGLSCAGPLGKSVTQQHFAGDVDINNIVARFLKTGILGDPTAIDRRAAVFADVSDFGDYHTSLMRIQKLQAAFMELPADLRNKFDNDAGKLVDFLADPANVPAAQEMGLLQKPVDNDKAAAEAAGAPPAPVIPPVSG